MPWCPPTTGGSTNAVLHLLAVAREAGIKLSIDDFDRINRKVPLLVDLKPGGRFVAADLYAAGGTTLVAKRLLEARLLHADQPTVTGRPIGEEAAQATETTGQLVVRPLSNPIKPTGGLVILKGNLAPEGCVVKVAGHSMMKFRGPAKVYDREEDAFVAVKAGQIKAGDVIVIRYEGPAGGPGMREMLGVTAAIVGAGLGDSVAEPRMVLWPAMSRQRRQKADRSPRSKMATRLCSMSPPGSSRWSSRRRRSKRVSKR